MITVSKKTTDVLSKLIAKASHLLVVTVILIANAGTLALAQDTAQTGTPEKARTTLPLLVQAGPPQLKEGEKANATTAYSAFQRGWFLTAVALATPLAEEGDLAAQALLGVLHEAGLGIKQDRTKAADWYQLAASKGDIGSALQLAQLYLVGNGVAADKAKAADYFEQAAEAGIASALFNLALIYEQGDGRPQNQEKALTLLKDAAQLNDPEAQYALGLALFQSQTNAAEFGQGAFWLGRAARRGHASAQVYYGTLRYQGKGVEPNEQEAADWFERAALAGNPVAMNRLARIYASGRGRTQDFASAAGLHLAATSLGVPDPKLDELVESLGEKTLVKARAQAQQYAPSLLDSTSRFELEELTLEPK